MNMEARSYLGIPAATWVAALAMGFSAAFLLAGYELMRSASQSLFIGAYTARNLPVVMMLAPLGTLLTLALYGRLLSAGGARRAIFYTSLLAAAAMVGCHAALANGSRLAAGVLYVLREAYIVLLVEQIWSFLDSTVRRHDGARLNGPICGLASLGAIAGGMAVRQLAGAMGSANLVLGAALSLLPMALLAMTAYRFGGEPQPPSMSAAPREHLGVGALFRNPMLRRLAVLIALTQVLSTVLDLQLSGFVEKNLPLTDERTAWFGGFYAGLNVLSAVFQFLVTPLLLATVSLRRIHLGIPLVHLVLAALALAHPALTTAAAAYLAFKVLDYSTFRAAKELLYVPLSYDERYRAKELIDAFTYRLAKGGVSGLLAIAGRVTAIPLFTYSALAAAVAFVWLPLARKITESHDGGGARD
jgi:AAA family ATP:ADP antiporter